MACIARRTDPNDVAIMHVVIKRYVKNVSPWSIPFDILKIHKIAYCVMHRTFFGFSHNNYEAPVTFYSAAGVAQSVRAFALQAGCLVFESQLRQT